MLTIHQASRFLRQGVCDSQVPFTDTNGGGTIYNVAGELISRQPLRYNHIHGVPALLATWLSTSLLVTKANLPREDE